LSTDDIIRHCILVVRDFNAERIRLAKLIQLQCEYFKETTKSVMEIATLKLPATQLATIVQRRLNQSHISDEVDKFRQVFK
jgi:hypothetical protein